MIVLKIKHVETKILNVKYEHLDDIKELLSYTTKEHYRSKTVMVKRTLYAENEKCFPTGLLSIVIKYLKTNKIEYQVEDSREVYCGDGVLPLHNITLRDYQKKAVEVSIKKQRGIILIATGGGKTVVAADIIAKLNVPTMFCVHTTDLLQQAHDELSKFLQIPIGIVGAGKIKIEKFNVCMIQTLGNALNFKYIPADEFDTYAENSSDMKSKKNILDMIEQNQCIIVDECHHVSAMTYVNLMSSLPNTSFRYGLSATPFRDDGRDLILQAFAGNLLCKISASFLIQNNYLLKPTIYMVDSSTTSKMYATDTEENYNTVYKNYIVNNTHRNKIIESYCEYFYKKKRKVLILVTQVNHGKIIYNFLKKIDQKTELLTGEVNYELRSKLIKKMKSGDLNFIIATSLADEGLDIPILDTLILAGGGKSGVKVLQRVGRIIRLHKEKNNPIVIDFNDNAKFLFGHTQKRLSIYKSEKEFVLG